MVITPTSNKAKQFSLRWIFGLLALAAIAAAAIGFALRPRPNRIPEAQLYAATTGVEKGMTISDVCVCLHLRPSASWLDQSDSGFAVWRFEVSDVRFDDNRASFFVKFEDGAVVRSVLLYPLESAGGGMTF